MIEPNLINDLPDMIQLAIMSINKTPCQQDQGHPLRPLRRLPGGGDDPPPQ